MDYPTKEYKNEVKGQHYPDNMPVPGGVETKISDILASAKVVMEESKDNLMVATRKIDTGSGKSLDQHMEPTCLIDAAKDILLMAEEILDLSRFISGKL